ncbi:hypothetical protein [Priestia megaterium]|uniref:hypothetical protein n=1 Tax=Priestia megaterium TaxID=1404 RepID=UPI00159C4A2F|nr:hypothetical protein [Priestia megaterium]
MKRSRRGKKVNGIIGWARAGVMFLTFILYVAIISLLSFKILGISLFSTALVYIIGSLIYYNLLKYTDKYHIRPIKDDKYKMFNGGKLVHYTEVIDEEKMKEYKQTGKLLLLGNSSAQSNYRMKYKDKTKKFVWFHTGNGALQEEPNIDSFLESHALESRPRKFKIVVDFEEVKDKTLYYNPTNGSESQPLG